MKTLLFTLLYLDPGTGSFIFQAIAAIGAGLALSYKHIKYYISNFFNKNKKEDLDE